MPSHTRTGGTYIVVLMSVLIVTTIGLSSLALVQSKEREARTTAAAAEARLLARSVIEAGMQFMAADPEWRTHLSGTTFSNMSFGNGTMSLTFTDRNDADVTDDDRDSVVLRGEGKVSAGQRAALTRQMVEVTLTPSPQPMAILQSAVHAAGLAEVLSGRALILSGGTLSSNNAVKNSGSVDGSLLAPSIQGYGFASGSKTTLVTAMPMPSSIVSAYAAKAVEIPYESNLQRWVLAPGKNPWGAAQADGLYVMRASGSTTLRRGRLNGTLVIINPGNTTTLERTVFMQNARADYPVLIVDGDLVIELDSSEAVVESDAGNLNPTGAPYNNVSDNDTSDSYPTEIRGLIYCTGKVQITGAVKIVGSIISASTSTSSYALQIAQNASVVYDPAIITSPPVGFTSGSPMQYVPSSWKQVVDP